MPPCHRRCLSCHRTAPREAFWRIVRIHPSGTIQLDQGMGRSAYLCPQASCLKRAERKNRLGRSLRSSVPNSIFVALWQRLGTTNPEGVGSDRRATVAQEA